MGWLWGDSFMCPHAQYSDLTLFSFIEPPEVEIGWSRERDVTQLVLHPLRLGHRVLGGEHPRHDTACGSS